MGAATAAAPSSRTVTATSSADSRWRIVLLCALAQNCAMGFAFGSFGPLLASTEEHFGVSRAMATMGMSMIMLAIGGLSPFLGSFLQRGSVRGGMLLGALLSAAGYWGLAVTSSFSVALAMFGLIGIGVCLTAILGPLTLISRWFQTNRGKMLSLVNLPVMLLLTPYLVAELLPPFGRFAVLGGLGTVCAALALLMLLLVEYPPIPVQRAVGVAASAATRGGEGLASIVTQPAFWLLSLGIGIMAGSGTGFVVHIVPFGMGTQMTLQSASALLSIYAAAGVAGTLFFGWVCDRIGPPAALVISAFAQALLWWGFLQVEGGPLYVLVAMLGVCVVPVVMLHGAAISHIFDSGSVSRAMGYSYSIKLPFIFGFAPGLGLMFDRSGDYDLPFLMTAALLAVAGACFYFMLLILRRQQPVAEAPILS